MQIKHNRRDFIKVASMGATSFIFLPRFEMDAGSDELAEGFKSPPHAASPHTFWHWMNGNVTREGITADLEAMREAGIGGVFLFVIEGHITESVPVYIDKPVRHLTPEWFIMLRHTAAECKRLGLNFSLMNCIGWTQSGGKWIPPEKSMMRIAWSEKYFKGGSTVRAVLPLPPCDYSNYQNLTADRDHIHSSVPPEERFYQDMAVVAYPLQPSTEKVVTLWPPLLSSSEAGVNLQHAIDDRGDTSVTIAEKGYLKLEFKEPVIIRGIEYLGSKCELQVGADGFNWRKIADLPGERQWGYPHSIPLTETREKFFRFYFPSKGVVKNIKLSPDSLVLDYQKKSAFHGVWEDIKVVEDKIGVANPDWVKASIMSKDVIDLTGKLEADGRLTWDVPPGDWMVVRMGCAPIGQLNGPSAREFSGLECNKLDADAVTFHFNQYAGRVADELKEYLGNGFHAVHVDSWEAGDLNFTPDFIEEFKERRGYDPVPYLLVHGGGRIVDSPAISDRFHWDVRRTLGDLLADNYYGKLQELCHKRGLQFQGEVAGVMLGANFDQLQIKGKCDMPMGECVMPNFINGDSWVRWDSFEAASAAHIHGKPIAGAEIFTCFDRWITDPYGLKGVNDLAFAMGINRLVFHTWALNSGSDKLPGMTMGPFGTNFSRLNTWWGSPAKDFVAYLRRCQYLLQQGLYVADILYFYGEAAPNTLPEKSLLNPTLPDGYSYDGCDAETLISKLSVSNGKLTLPGGMSYRILVVKESKQMTPEVLRKLQQLAKDGAIIHASRPETSPSLQNYPLCDKLILQMADELWGNIANNNSGANSFGKGKVFSGISVEDVLKAINVAPDITMVRRKGDGPIYWIHRNTSDADIYFFTNQKRVIDHGLSLEIIDRRYEALAVNEIDEDEVELDVSFRINSKQPEIWDAVSGSQTQITEFRQEESRTIVPLSLPSSGSCFVVFRKPLKSQTIKSYRKNFPETKSLFELTGSWNVSFDKKWGGPGPVVFQKLEDWTLHPEPGIKYYSGKATYSKIFDLKITPGKGTSGKTYLDLGRLRSIAEIRLNGKKLGILWCPPWKVDVTNLLKQKDNKLEIDIINVWANRLIGDAGLPVEKRLTWTSLNDTRWSIKADATLVPAGLYGPVTINQEI